MPILRELTDGPGYCLGYRLTEEELAVVRATILRQYLERLANLAPGLVEQAASAGLENYHTLHLPFDHGSSWPKEARLLPRRHVADFSRMQFFRAIEREFGPVQISHDELNWRLVRPGHASDVGPIHLDKWFWDAGYGEMPEGYQRFKIWIAVHTEPGANGLLVKPGSQKQNDWKHHFELRNGVFKPVLDEDLQNLNMQLLHLGPGEMVLFHDDLLHGGAVNGGTRCRISIELTVLYRAEQAISRPTRVRPSRAIVPA